MAFDDEWEDERESEEDLYGDTHFLDEVEGEVEEDEERDSAIPLPGSLDALTGVEDEDVDEDEFIDEHYPFSPED